MTERRRKIIFYLIRPVIFFLAIFFLLANAIQVLAQIDASAERQQQILEAELKRIEAEIVANRKLLDTRQKESASIARDIDILTFQINQAKLNIQARQIEIKRLGGDINKRETYIETLDEKIYSDKESLAELLRKTRQLDDINLVELVLQNNTLSDVFIDLDSFNFIQEAMHGSFVEIRKNQGVARDEKEVLRVKQDAELEAKIAIEEEKKLIERKDAEKKRLLSLSRSQENTYKQVIAQREADVAAIRSALFRLRNTDSISFGEAYDLASKVSTRTSVRTAIILAIITQESNLGENIGTCNRVGDPPTKSWQNIMPGPNDGGKSYRDDQTLFLQITKELGLDPNTTPLSCPIGGGWGGAMGPSQFIPTTWMTYKDRITQVTGSEPPNPWNPLDAFTATGLLLKDLGAAGGSFTAERTAALRYYAGGNWNKPKNAFYGDSVMQIAEGYERQIQILRGT